MKPWIDTFNEKYIPEPMSGCWLWTGALSGSMGYGFMRRFPGEHASYKYAHRFSWEHHHGPVPDGMHVLHKCDIPTCVNPDHLFLGTLADNMRDCKRKGRMPDRRGDNAGRAILSSSDIPYIRESSESLRTLARKFGVEKTTIWSILHRRSWAHIP